ncbi:MAG: ABC transporter substrate-binding protein [Actinobacteria bacterium]|nr:MAG: ABC transporter substrate-binding protein [Actinomycetota bacterium]
MKRRTIALVAVLGLLAGCGPTPSTPSDSSAASFTPQFPATAGGVTLTARPTHIVSLSPTATEMLYAMDAAGQVTAVDDQSNFPDNAPRTNLSGFKPDVEAIAAKNPDLVVISEDTNKVKEQLTKLKIPVYQAPAARSLDDVYAQLRDLGTLTGQRPQADAVVQYVAEQIKQLVAALPKRTRPLTYYYELDPTLYTVTSKTFIGSLMTLAGLQNIADPADKTASGYPQLSQEYLLQANPDLIFLADTVCCKQSLETVKARPGWAGLTAVSKGQVVALNDDIASRWGPRVVDLLKAITDAVGAVPAS